MENQIENYLKAIEANEPNFEFVDACDNSSKVLVLSNTSVEHIDLDGITKFHVDYIKDKNEEEYEIHLKGKYTNYRINLTNRNMVAKLLEILIRHLKKDKIQVVVPDKF